MHIIIHDASTWHNLNRLRDHAFNNPLEVSKISILIDCDTGEINIPQALNDLEMKIHQVKKKSAQRLKYSELLIAKTEHGMNYELRELDSVKLEPRAAKAMEEMLEILNTYAATTSSLKENLLTCIRSVKMDLSIEISNHPAWKGKLDREEAEALLLQSPSGTYLLREGGLDTQRIEYHLQKSSPFPVRCYVITIVEEENKISDRMLIQRTQGWALFNDDVHLECYTYETLQDAIKKLGGVYPLKTMHRAA